MILYCILLLCYTDLIQKTYNLDFFDYFIFGYCSFFFLMGYKDTDLL